MSPSLAEFLKEVLWRPQAIGELPERSCASKSHHPALECFYRGAFVVRRGGRLLLGVTSGRSVSERSTTCHIAAIRRAKDCCQARLLRYRSCCPAAMMESLSKAPSLLLHHRLSPGPCFTGSPTCYSNALSVPRSCLEPKRLKPCHLLLCCPWSASELVL